MPPLTPPANLPCSPRNPKRLSSAPIEFAEALANFVPANFTLAPPLRFSLCEASFARLKASRSAVPQVEFAKLKCPSAPRNFSRFSVSPRSLALARRIAASSAGFARNSAKRLCASFCPSLAGAPRTAASSGAKTSSKKLGLTNVTPPKHAAS